MADIEKQIQELTVQLQELKSWQLQMNAEMVMLEAQLKKLKADIFPDLQSVQEAENIAVAAPAFSQSDLPSETQLQQNLSKKVLPPKRILGINRETEDFIGTNIISKIGILFTIIGVFIGAKYAIDNELISPFMRILAGYSASAALLFVAFRLKKKYAYFSSVLMGGGLAVAYFITYIAFSFYSLLPMWLAFAVMIMITGATVAIALWYNQKVIALIGQIAAYAIPFLLGTKNGNVFGLFAYISFINIGLLLLSFRKNWKTLYHIAFFLTWLIYISWLIGAAELTKHFSAGLLFLTVNFFTFYITFVSYKILKKEQYSLSEISILLLNALFYFFTGIYLINESFQNIHFLTSFAIANAFIHFAAGYFIYRLKLADNTVFQFAAGLGLLFVTVAIPIEFNRSWVTLLWTVEATTIFYIASANQRALYFDIAVPLVVIAALSLLQDWTYSYAYLEGYNAIIGLRTIPFANENFYLSLFVCACLGYISYTGTKRPFTAVRASAAGFFNKAIPVAFLFLLYFSLYNEIHFTWDKIIFDIPNKTNIAAVRIMPLYRSVTLLVFSCLYIASWLFINIQFIKKEETFYLLLLLAVVANVAFLAKGLYQTGELREIYLAVNSSIAFSSLLFYRYLLFAAAGILWICAYKSVRIFETFSAFKIAFAALFNLTLLTVISNEFIHWMDLAGYQNQYKLGLTLICGAYALALIFTGIIRKKKHLRIAAMLLFSVTLLKLFFYDLASLSTISKTIVLVLLGILLLFASFLYNKYKDPLSGKEGN